MDAIKLNDWLKAFIRARTKGVSMLEGFANRLTNEFVLAGLIRNASEGIYIDSTNEEKKLIAARRAVKKSETISKWALFKMLLKQKYELNKSINSKEHKDVNCIAISTKRINISSPKATPRSRLKSIFEALPDASSVEFSDFLNHKEKHLILCIPYRSELWDNIDYYWSDNCYIVDYYYLGFLLITSPKIILREIWINKRLFSIEEMLINRESLVVALTAVLMTAAYKALFANISCSNAALLTSNSFASEVLRVFMLNHKSSVIIYEILHGVPTLEFEEYFDSIIDKTQKSQKHYFIPQIKGLPHIGILSDSMHKNSELAINVAMNQYFMCRCSNYQEIEKIMIAELTNVVPNYKQSTTLIISFMGATSHEGSFFKSRIFLIEKIIMEHVRNYLISRDLNFKIVYSPHPANNIKECQQLEFFTENEITLYQDTKYMWLVADAAIALYSSALFDAVYSGLKVFSPLKVNDGFYEPVALKMISHPEIDESCLSALDKFISDVIARPFGDQKSNINARLPKWVRMDSISQ